VGTLFIAKGSPWENGYVESLNGKLRDELLNRELILSLEESRWVIDCWWLDSVKGGRSRRERWWVWTCAAPFFLESGRTTTFARISMPHCPTRAGILTPGFGKI
jgi:hypothetical protein